MGGIKKNKISIVTPVYAFNKTKVTELIRAIESIKSQTYNHDFIEHIIVNDGSIESFQTPTYYPWLKIINQENRQRLAAYNNGLQHTTGDIICFLDSDDEYVPTYLSEVNKMFNKYPEYKMFNFGSHFVWEDGHTSQREAFEPKELPVGHEEFGGGNIVNGTFVFHRSIYEDLGGFPPLTIKNIDCTDVNYPASPTDTKPYIRDLHMWSPYDFSAYAQLKFPEIRKFFMVNHEGEPEKIIKELGNPFGNDFYLFYKFTRKYHSKAIKEKFLYTVHIRPYANP